MPATYELMTSPGKRNIGPPKSAAQWPPFDWSLRWNEYPFLAASNGLFALGSDGRFYTEVVLGNGTPK